MSDTDSFKIYKGNIFVGRSYPTLITAVIEKDEKKYAESYVVSDIFNGNVAINRLKVDLNGLPVEMKQWSEVSYLEEDSLNTAQQLFDQRVFEKYEDNHAMILRLTDIVFSEDDKSILHRFKIHGLFQNELKAISDFTYSDSLKGYINMILAITHIRLSPS